ncbi:MAG: oligosaccharide flippase family protein [Polyangiaceae bacterium]|nr:oligosaccharide flippase family protein [Polyangiaceae bacterium]
MTSQAAADPSKSDQAATRAAGRGGLAIAVAKVSFILVGFVQQLVFPRVLDEAGYGAVSRMLAVVSIVNNVVVAMSLQGVSRMVVQAKDDEKEAAVRKTLVVHAVIAILTSTIFAVLAGHLADWIEAPSAAKPLRVAAGVVLCYGVYAPLVGALNGKKRFLDQAGLDIFYGISRTAAMTTAAWLFAHYLGGDGALGAAVGFVCAAMLIVPIAMWRNGIGKAGPGGPSVDEYLRFLIPLFVAQFGLNVLLQLDLLLLSEASGEHARLMGLDPKEADKLLAPYRATQLFGFLPYQMLMSVQFVLFPMLAKASAEADTEGVKRLTRAGMRIALLLTGLIAGTIGSLAPHLVRFAYPENIALQAAPFARAYTLGLSGLAILGVASSALASLRRELWSMVLTWVAAGLVAVSIITLRRDSVFGPDLLQSTAQATAIAMLIAATIGALALYRAAGALMRPLTLVRVLFAIGIVVAIGSRIPWMGKLMAPVQAIAMGIVYIVLLIVTGEVGRADLASIRAVVSRRKG